MSTGICRSVSFRNSTPSLSSSSSPSSSSLATPSNQTNISDAEWITHSISLIMFLTAFVGNTAALIVMFASRGPIRLTNNKYLANLACADLLRACFIPFTIIARMKRNFIFGGVICKILPIVQGERMSDGGRWVELILCRLRVSFFKRNQTFSSLMSARQ